MLNHMKFGSFNASRLKKGFTYYYNNSKYTVTVTVKFERNEIIWSAKSENNDLEKQYSCSLNDPGTWPILSLKKKAIDISIAFSLYTNYY